MQHGEEVTGTPGATGTIGSSARYGAETVVNLFAGDVLSLQLYGLLGSVTLTQAGASLAVQPVE